MAIPSELLGSCQINPLIRQNANVFQFFYQIFELPQIYPNGQSIAAILANNGSLILYLIIYNSFYLFKLFINKLPSNNY